MLLCHREDFQTFVVYPMLYKGIIQYYCYILLFYCYIVLCVYITHCTHYIFNHCNDLALNGSLIGNKHICICIYIQSKKKWNGLKWTFSYSRLIKMGEGTIVIKCNVKSTISFKMVCKLKHFSLQRAGVVNNTKKLKNLISVTDPTCNKFNLHDRRKHWQDSITIDCMDDEGVHISLVSHDIRELFFNYLEGIWVFLFSVATSYGK